MMYAIVPSRGRYGSSQSIRPMPVRGVGVELRDLIRARRLAERWTRDFRAGMRRYGGTSGGYRVVEYREEWLGWELDQQVSL